VVAHDKDAVFGRVPRREDPVLLPVSGYPRRGDDRLRGDCHLQHTVALMAEQIIGRLDIVQLEAVRYH
jgi:hypothetical protein